MPMNPIQFDEMLRDLKSRGCLLTAEHYIDIEDESTLPEVKAIARTAPPENVEGLKKKKKKKKEKRYLSLQKRYLSLEERYLSLEERCTSLEKLYEKKVARSTKKPKTRNG